MNKTKKVYQRFLSITQYGLGQIISVFSIFLLSFFIVKFHSISLWGHYAELLIWTNLILLFLSFGSYDYLLKALSDHPSKANQLWANNLITRGIFLIPSGLAIWFIPIFDSIEFWVIFLIVLQFLLQSFKVLIVFNKQFNLSILVESLFNITLITLLFWKGEFLDLTSLVQIICLALLLKFVLYSIFLLRKLSLAIPSIQPKDLRWSAPYFAPVLLGTIRSKIDMYYGAHFFNPMSLGKYQILINFLMLAQLSSSFIITPFIKTLYRSKNAIYSKLHLPTFLYGWLFALLCLGFIYLGVTHIYEIHFSPMQYFFAFVFMVPLITHVLLISEYYKRDLPLRIVQAASLVVLIQLTLGYFFTKSFELNGALALKALGQWVVVIVLWIWIKGKHRE